MQNEKNNSSPVHTCRFVELICPMANRLFHLSGEAAIDSDPADA